MDNQPQSNKQYTPVNSELQDLLEASAHLNQNCEITYRSENGFQTKIISRVINLYTENDTTYVKLENQSIPLSSIESVNAQIDDMPENINYNQASAISHTGFTEHGDRSMGTTQAEDSITDKEVAGNITEWENVIAKDESRLAAQEASMHQSDVLEDNLLGQAAFTPSLDTDVHTHKVDSSDFVHQFTTANTPFLISQNDYYTFTADRLRNRLYLKVLQAWDEPEDVSELGIDFNRIASLMTSAFTLLNDLTALEADENGALMAPALPNKDILLNAGLVKVADLVPHNCDTLIHGLHSFSVNSLRLRYFKDRSQAEHWLGDDHRSTGTPDDMSLN